MSESETVYSPLKTYSETEFSNLISSFPKPQNLIIPNKIFGFCLQAFTQGVFKQVSGYSRLENLGEINGNGTIIVPCINDSELLGFVLEKFAKVNGMKKVILMIPEVSPESQFIFENHPSSKDIKLLTYQIEIVPLGNEHFVVPLPHTFINYFCDSDISDVYPIAHALLKLQVVSGKPSRVFVAGSASSRVNSLMNELSTPLGSSVFSDSSYFQDLFIIDRTCDLLTPMLTQWTYGGIVDETFNPQFNYLPLPEDITLTIGDSKLKTTTLGPNDPVYTQIQHMRTADAAKFMSNLQSEGVSVTDSMRASTGTQIWRNLKRRADQLCEQMPYNAMHMSLLEKATDFKSLFGKIINCELNQIEQIDPDYDLIYDLISRERNVEALKLLCIASLTNRGIPQSVRDRIAQSLLNLHGYGFLKEWIRLESSGLLSVSKGMFGKDTKPKFSVIAEGLGLIDKKEGSELSAYYSNYIPILVRLVEKGIKEEWKPGTPSDQILTQSAIPHSVQGKVGASKKRSDGKEFRRALVFVIGGVTQSEIMMFSKIGSALFDYNYEFHVGSTSVISAKSLLCQICPSLSKN